MNPPGHTSIANIHHFAFDDFGVTATVNRIREDSRAVTAYLSVRHNGRLLDEGRINLESPRSRADHAKECETEARRTALADPETPWKAVVQSIAILTLRKHREGEPARRMSEHVPSEGMNYLVKPFLFERHPNLVYGDGGTGKSLLADYIITLLANGQQSGGKANPAQPTFEVQYGNCLSLDWESDADDFWYRLKGLHKGLGFDELSPGLYHRYCARPFLDDLEEIQAMVVEHDIDMVVIDSAAYAVGGDPKDESQVIPFFNALRSLKCTSFIIGHVPKDNPGQNPFGSVFWRNGARSMWRVAHQQETGEHSFGMGLFHMKTNLSERLDPIGLRFGFDGSLQRGGTIKVTSMNVRDDPEMVNSSGDITLKILSVLSSPKPVSQIAEETREPQKRVSDALSSHRVGNAKHLRELFVLNGGLWARMSTRAEGS